MLIHRAHQQHCIRPPPITNANLVPVAFMRDGMYSFLSSKITYCHSLIARNNATTGWEDNQRMEEGGGGEGR